MDKNLRESGLDIIGDVKWGAHFCQFYHTKDDLLDVLVPYFKAGLENNEFCIWVTSEPLNEQDAKEAMRGALPDFDIFLARGQIEIIPYSEWYVRNGVFNAERVLKGWVDKLNGALANGYEGMRLTGNTFWLEKKDWKSFKDYEETVHGVIGKSPLIALCTYSLGKCGAKEIMDVVSNHQFALVKNEGRWSIVESSERKRAEKQLLDSEKRYRGLYESIKDGIVRCDIKGSIIDCNQAYLDMLGYNRAEIEKLTYQRLTPLKWHKMEAQLVQDQIMGRGYSDEYEKEYIRKDGTVFPVNLKVWLIKNEQGGPEGTWAIIRDITERKEAEEKINKLNEELKLNIARLEDVNKELVAFSYSLAHDLGAPVRIIDGFSRIVLDDYSDKLDDTGKEFLGIIRNNTQKMGQFIHDLLSLSRLGRLEMNLRDINMSELAKDVFDELKAAAPGRTIQCSIKRLPHAKGERTMIHQVFTNLIGNAVKFTRQKKNAVVEVGGRSEKNENVYYVKDNGVGFDMKHSERLFGVFKRLHTDDEFEGTGAGLAIVQRIITRHGGRVWAEARVNEGATLYFTIPKDPSEDEKGTVTRRKKRFDFWG